MQLLASWQVLRVLAGSWASPLLLRGVPSHFYYWKKIARPSVCLRSKRRKELRKTSRTYSSTFYNLLAIPVQLAPREKEVEGEKKLLLSSSLPLYVVPPTSLGQLGTCVCVYYLQLALAGLFDWVETVVAGACVSSSECPLTYDAAC